MTTHSNVWLSNFTLGSHTQKGFHTILFPNIPDPPNPQSFNIHSPHIQTLIQNPCFTILCCSSIFLSRSSLKFSFNLVVLRCSCSRWSSLLLRTLFFLRTLKFQSIYLFFFFLLFIAWFGLLLQNPCLLLKFSFKIPVYCLVWFWCFDCLFIRLKDQFFVQDVCWIFQLIASFSSLGFAKKVCEVYCLVWFCFVLDVLDVWLLGLFEVFGLISRNLELGFQLFIS